MPKVAIKENIAQLTLPPLAVARHPETIIHVNELRKWLDNLPLADPEHLVSSLHKQLRLLTHDPQDNARYKELLNAYHPTLNHIQELVWQDLHQPKKKMISAQLRTAIAQVLLETASGHMRLINQHIARGKSPEATDLYHALLPMVRLAQWDILQYRLTRPALWRNILHLYAFVEHFNSGDKHVESHLKLAFDPADSRGVFFSILTLLLSDPYRLADAQQQALITILGQFSDQLNITQKADTQHNILLDLGGMLPPLRLARQHLEPKKRRYLQLDVFFEQIKYQALNSDKNADICRWLVNSLGTLAKLRSGKEGRLHSRHAQVADYNFIQGITQIHSRLQTLQTGLQQAAKSQTGIYLESDDTEISPMMGTPCRQIEQSSTGCSFVLHDKRHIPDVGDWLLLETTPDSVDQQSSHIVAQIRRRLQREDNSNEMGVEKLSGTIIPVTLSLNAQIGLLSIDEASGLKQLITSRGNFVAGQKLTLHSANGDYAIRYDKLLENNNSERIGISLL